MLDANYYDPEREGCLADMARAMNIEDGPRFLSLFKRAFQNMEEQRLEIRQARKALFDFDRNNEPGTDIDLELSRCDDLVCFDVHEPDFNVPQES